MAAPTTIFTEMTALAERSGAINLGQGFPDEDGPSAIVEAEEAGVAAIPVSAFTVQPDRLGRWCGSRSASGPTCWTRRSIVCNAGPVMADRATTLRELHEAPKILVLANVWDAAGARAVAAVEGTRALATASHAIAGAHGYDDGEHIPLDLHLAAVERVTAATELPVSMDFESGYRDPGETTRRPRRCWTIVR